MPLLAAGPLLEERIRSACKAAGDNVFTSADLAGVREKAQLTPALHLVMHGYKPLSDDTGPTSRWQETWLVVAVVKNVRQNAGAAPVRDDAAALLAETMAALDGWRCPGAVGLVRAIAPPQPLITDGFGYFPLAFSVITLTKGVVDA